ncbi:MAG: UDP-N-acetylmuramoyl-L-alanyl-D-glutamate--2,6-diaminopimelate ligase [Sphingomicrobium sp.]
MRLSDLSGIDSEAVVTGFAIDHRNVTKGNVFGAFRGERFDGESFICRAVEHGAVAVVARPEALVEGAAHIADAEPRRRFASLAGKFYGPYPEVIVAVTGTNGKTSTVEMARQMWRMAGHRSASIGTLGVTTADDQVKTGLTTPDIVTFLSNMAGLERMGISHVAYEASSHGLDQFRSEGLPVVAAAFTNFSRDHLDYHVDMESYFAAKMRLFDEVVESDGTAVVWTGDARSTEVVQHVRARALKLITVGPGAETIGLIEQVPTPLGQRLVLRHHGKDYRLTLPLIGAYQANNVLTAAGLLIGTGTEWDDTLAAMGRVSPVRGRLERAVISRAGAPVYVDYAHTPDALEAAIAALKPHVERKLITVFGAGGDRDIGKREPMGAVAARMSDVAIVTDDNPRTEDPAKIRHDVMQGAIGATEIGDRRAAIAEAIRLAGPGDIVLVAGKGHETGQVIGDRIFPFDDALVARECAA